MQPAWQLQSTVLQTAKPGILSTHPDCTRKGSRAFSHRQPWHTLLTCRSGTGQTPTLPQFRDLGKDGIYKPKSPAQDSLVHPVWWWLKVRVRHLLSMDPYWGQRGYFCSQMEHVFTYSQEGLGLSRGHSLRKCNRLNAGATEGPPSGHQALKNVRLLHTFPFMFLLLYLRNTSTK